MFVRIIFPSSGQEVSSVIYRKDVFDDEEDLAEA
jgi:hypothetical protein